MVSAQAVDAAVQPSITAVRRFAYVPALDGCRALSIGLVFLGHAKISNAIPGGFGVTIFFFLSGYLITSLLRDEFSQNGVISFSGFYSRRLLRIVPPLFICLGILAALTQIGVLKAQMEPIGVLAQIFFVSNYAALWGYGENGVPGMPLWSLAVEEHFYIVFPVVALWAFRHWNGPRFATAMTFACAAVLAIRCIHVFVFHDVLYTYYLSHSRIDSILFGCILAVWNNPVMDRDAWQPGRMALALAVLALATGFVITAPAFRETVRYSIQGAALFVLFSALLHARGGLADKILAIPAIVYIGRWSYTFYLVHYFALLACTADLGLGRIGTAVIAGSSALLFAALMYVCVENPIAVMRRKLRAA